MNARFALVAVVLASAVASGSLHAAPCAGFTDVDDTNPFCASIAWIKSRGITLGCGSTTYCPNDPVTRAQMAAFMSRLDNMLVPILEDWNGVPFGTYLVTPDRYRQSPYVKDWVQYKKAGSTYFIPIELGSVQGRIGTGFVFSSTGSHVYYELPFCNDAGKKWIMPQVAPPSDRYVGVIPQGAGKYSLFGGVGPAGPGAIASSVRYSWSGSCAEGTSSLQYGVEAIFLGEVAVELPLRIR